RREALRARDDVLVRLGARAGEVVLLEQHLVEEPGAVVRTAADGDRVLLEVAQTRRRLAGVEDRRPAAGDGVDEAPGHRRDAGQALQEVQRDALAGEDRRGIAVDRRDDRAGLELGAVL